MVECDKMSPDEKKRMLKNTKETIHSGHFMVSEIDDNEVVEEIHSPSVVHESDCDQETSNEFQFVDVPKETKKEVYTFGPRSSHSISIEVSLTQLFQCMSLAYSGKLTSPRWKTFKGLKLRLKDKIRLNNIIWRAWHIQFISKRKPPVCQFASPLDSDAHNKPEVMVVEENLWKSKVSSITAEYKKRRMYFKDRYRAKQRKSSPDSTIMAMDLDSRWSPWGNNCMSPGSAGIDEDLFIEFSDTLFSSFLPNQPFDLPNPREIAAKVGIADFIQPGLAQLQPSLDDFMDTFEPLQDFLTTRLPPLVEEGPEQSVLDNLTSLASQQIQSYRNVASQPKQFSVPSISQNVNSCETVYPAEGQSFPVHQQNTSSNVIASTLECSNINTLHSRSVIQDVNSLSVNINDTQPTLRNSISPIVNSGVITPDLSVSASLRPSLQTNQKNKQSLISFQPLNVPQSNEKHNLNQSVPDFNSALDIVSQNCKQSSSSFHISSHLSSSLPSQVPMPVVSQNRTQQVDRHISNRSSRTSTQISSTPNTDIAGATYQTPVHIANVVPFQLPLTTQSHISLSTVEPSVMNTIKSESPLHKFGTTGRLITPKTSISATANESQIRRHSYTGLSVVDSVNRRGSASRIRTNLANVANVPSVTSEAKFAVPEVPVKQRVRSRSVSSPQIGIGNANSQQPSSSVSLTNINVSPPPVSQFSITGDTHTLPSKNSFVPNKMGGRTTPTVLPQNAVLAQLLTSGTALAPRIDRQSTFPTLPTTTITTTTSTLSSTVTIINTIPTLAATTPTFVLSPVAIATVASVPNLQQSLFVDTNQIVGCQPALQDRTSNNMTPTLMNSSADPNNSPNKPFRPKSDEERVQYKEHRRVCHINAEQKRRCNIKNGFEQLRHLLPSLSQNPNAKVSKAAMLQKGAEYIRALKVERQQQQEEAELLRQQRDSLNESISIYQNQLPATGAPIPCQRTNRMRELFDDYVRTQTLQNWKFWIFSLLMEPLLETYNNTVSTGSIKEMCESVLEWVNQHCSLVALRPGVLNSLRNLCTTTNFLTDPTRLPEEATKAVTKKENSPQ